jgi:hypothetical protein
MMPIRPDLGEAISVGNRQAILLPEGYALPDEGPWVLVRFGDGLRLVPYVEANWAWGNGLAGSMEDEWALAVEDGRTGPDHPDNALDDEPVFE